MTKRRAIWAFLLAACGPALAVQANPWDVFGLGARHKAMGRTGTALATDAAAVHYNPAGLAQGDRFTLTIDYAAALPQLQVNRQAQDTVDDSRGFTFGTAVPFDLGPLTAAFGMGLYLPDQRQLQLRLRPVEEPYYLMYDNRTQRFAFTSGAALEIIEGLSIGGGVTVLGRVEGNGISFDLLLRGALERANSRLDLAIQPQFAPLAGIMYRPLDNLVFGLSWRGEQDLVLKLDLDTTVEISAVDVQGLILIGLFSRGFWMPHRFAFGAAYDPLPNFTVALDLVYELWSRFPPAAPDLQVIIDIGTQDVSLAPRLLDLQEVRQEFANVLSPRLGLEYRWPTAPWVTLAPRGGFVFEPSPAPLQTGVESVLDNDRLIFTAGCGVEFRDAGEWLVGPLKLDLSFDYTRLLPRLHVKDNVTMPYPVLDTGGYLEALGATLSVGF